MPDLFGHATPEERKRERDERARAARGPADAHGDARQALDAAGGGSGGQSESPGADRGPALPDAPTGVLRECRIHGPPGTGKTQTVQAWVQAATERYGRRGVLVSSFTKAAASELATRGVNAESEMVGTLHALCYRALGRPLIAEMHASDWNTYCPHMTLSGETKGALDELTYEASTPGDQLLMECNRLRARMVRREAWPESVRVFDKRWREWKDEGGLLDFTDMIEQAIGEPGAVLRDARVAFVDEAQDLSPLELSLVRSWRERLEFLVLVGDADQCIYGFKGATPRAFLEPAIPERDERVLAQSWRVPRTVHSFAHEWIRRCEYRKDTDYRPREHEGAVTRPPLIYADGDGVATAVQNAPGTTMVLTTCSYMLNPTIRALRERGIPFHNPYRTKAGNWNPMRGGADRLRDFLGGCDGKRWTWAQLNRWTQVVRAQGVLARGAKSIIEAKAKARASASMMVEPDDARALFEPEAWSWLRASMDNGRPLEWLAGHLLASKRRLVDYALRVARVRGVQALSDTPRVIVGTIHSVKGGQADSVLMFPDISPSGAQEWEQRGEPSDGVRRVFYVGATRARERLALCQPSSAYFVDWRR